MDSHTTELTVPGPAPISDPFSLIVNPQAVLDAMQRSERLHNLQRRVYRPLGQPLTGDREGGDVTAFDAAIDAETAEPEPRPRAARR
jgi:hypothetical protein